MDRKSKILTASFFALFVIAAVWKYHDFVIQQDFIVYDYVSCDPEAHSCFDYCEDGECDEEPYAKIEKHAGDISLCKTYESNECEEVSCEQGKEGCEITYCSEDTLEEGEVCFVPEESLEEGEEVEEKFEE